MSIMGRALAYMAFGLTASEAYNLADLGKIDLGNSTPRISRKPKATHGKRHASQRSRASRRKAGMKARARR